MRSSGPSVSLGETGYHLSMDCRKHQVDRCLEKSSAIACRRGDQLVKKGNVAQNMFVVLAGVLEVRDNGESVGILTAGDIIGETAFLLQTPRSKNVYAITDDVRVLSLSESQIRKIIESEPEIAAKVLLNISKMLCARLLKVRYS